MPDEPNTLDMPMPYSQADDLETQGLLAGIAKTRAQVNEGELHPDEGAELVGKYQQQLQPLLKQKQQTAELAEQQQLQSVQKQTAAMQAMGQSNMMHGAQNFPETVGSFTDPGTGETSFHRIQPDGSSEPIGSGQATGGPKIEEPTDEKPIEAIDPADMPDTNSPPPPAAVAGPGGEHRMTIRNGQWEETHVFDKDTGRSLRTEYPRDSQGHEIKPPWVRAWESENAATTNAGTAMGLSERDHTMLMRQAELHTPPVRLTGNARQDSINISHRNQQVSENYRMLVNDVLKQRRGKAAEQAKIDAENRKQGGAMTVGKQLGITPTEISKMLEKHMADVDTDTRVIPEKEAITYKGQQYWGSTKNLPPEVRRAIAAQRLMDHLSTLQSAGQDAGLISGGSGVHPRTPGSSAGGSAAAPQSKPAPVVTPEQSTAAVDQLRVIQNQAFRGGDREANQAATKLMQLTTQYGHLSAAPAEQQAEIRKALAAIDKYRAGSVPQQ